MLRWRIRDKRWTSKRSGNFSRRILGIELPAVESTHNLSLQTIGIGCILSLDHFLAQLAQLLRRERLGRPDLADKVNVLVLFRAGETFNLINYFHYRDVRDV